MGFKTTQIPANPTPKQSFGELQDLADRVQGQLRLPENKGKIPYYLTGARAFLKVGGKAVGVAQDVRWSVSYNAEPIMTVDTPHPWDIDVGPVNIVATISKIIDPTSSLEAEGLFAVMAAAVHQPMVEMQLLDASGTSIFFARGMFVSMNGSVSRGSLGSWGANFVGTVYQHYVQQFFKPYNSLAGSAQNFVKAIKNLSPF